MATQRYYDDVLASLVERVNYIERRVSNSETADTSFGLTHAGLAGLGADDHTQYHNDTRGDIRYYTKAQAVAYTGTPTASSFAVWTAAGTLAGTTLNTSSFVISQGVAGGQQVAGDTAISGSLHIYGTNYSAGTGNPNFTAIYFAPSKGLTPTLATRMDHDGDWTFTRNILVQGTLSAEDTDITHSQLAGLTTGDPHTQYLLLAGRSGGQTVYAGPGTADTLAFFASDGDSGGGADVAFDFWTGTDPSDINALSILHNGDVLIADKLAHIGDTNTAIRFPADDTVTIETAGVERVQVDSAGVTITGNTFSGGDFLTISDGINTNGEYIGILFDANVRSRSARLAAYHESSTSIGIKIYTDNSGTPVEAMTVTGSGNVGIGTTGPSGKTHIDQASTTAAIPVLILDQADLSEEFIEFDTTVGAGNPVDTAALGTYYGKVRVSVNGTFKYIPLYNS